MWSFKKGSGVFFRQAVFKFETFFLPKKTPDPFLNHAIIFEKSAPEIRSCGHYNGRAMITAQLSTQEKSSTASASDRRLLVRFVSGRDELAFAELVRRHGRLVLGVCRRILRDEQDSEDAFQATFLILAKNAAKIRKRASLASWLYAVAHRIAVRASMKKYRRREETIEDEFAITDDSLANVAERHQQRLVDEELNRLPAKYRDPIVLHYVLGKTTKEVAEQLQISAGAVEGRLKRGNKELRSRLVKHGVGVGMAVAALHLTQSSVPAATVEALVTDTAQAALAYSSGVSPVGSCSQQAIRLAGKEMNAMITPTTSAICGTIVLALAAGLVGYGDMSPAIGEENSPQITTEIGSAASVASTPARPDVLVVAEPSKVAPAPAPPPVPGIRSARPPQPGVREHLKFSTVDYKERSVAEVRIEVALSSSTDFEFVDVPLKDMVEFISQLHNIQVLVDREALKEEGIQPDEPITLTLSQVSLKSGLRVMMEPLGLEYLIQNEVLMITTRIRADETMDTRVYNLRALSGMDGQELSQIIEESIRSSPWEEIDGEGGVIHTLEGCLVVTQSQRVHEDIRSLLAQLQRHQSNSPAKTPPRASHD